MHAVNSNGTLRWNFKTGDMMDSSPVVGPDGTIYIGSEDHSLYAVNSDGSQKWHFQTGGAIHSSPAIAGDGTVYVGSQDTSFYAVSAPADLATVLRPVA